MKFTIKIKPTKCEASTKNGLIDKISYGYIKTYMSSKSFDTFGVYIKDNKVLVFNLLKVRKKVQRFGVNGKKLKKTKVLSPKKWIAYVYVFDIEMLKMCGVKKIKQESRNFKLIY